MGSLYFSTFSLHHCPPVLLMIIIKWGCRNIDHQIRVLRHEMIHRAILVQGIVTQVPDILRKW